MVLRLPASRRPAMIHTLTRLKASLSHWLLLGETKDAGLYALGTYTGFEGRPDGGTIRTSRIVSAYPSSLQKDSSWYIKTESGSLYRLEVPPFLDSALQFEIDKLRTCQ
jgi:hypothetical protein